MVMNKCLFNNKKGQKIIVLMMLSIMVFIVAVVIIQPLNETTTTVMNATYLNCTSETITVYEKTTCNILDMGFFYFISVCIAVGLALITGKRTITGIFTSIFVFVVVILLITPLKEWIILARDSAHLNCAAASITIGSRLLCIFVDLWLFYFVIVVISTAIAYIFLTKFGEK